MHSPLRNKKLNITKSPHLDRTHERLVSPGHLSQSPRSTFKEARDKSIKELEKSIGEVGHETIENPFEQKLSYGAQELWRSLEKQHSERSNERPLRQKNPN